jgi:hypothetical protein
MGPQEFEHEFNQITVNILKNNLKS